jgi:nitrilase
MADAFPKLRLAAIQAAPVWLDRDATVAKACDLIREAGSQGAQFIGFPENFIPGHPVWFYFHPATSPKSAQLSLELFKNAVEIPSPSTDELCSAARDAGAYVVVGLTERLADTTGTLFNTQLFIDSGGRIVGKHQKLVPTIGERLVHMGGSGESMRTFPSPYGPVSGLCCGENSNPLAVAVLAAEYTRIHVASWPNHFIPSYCGMCESSLLAGRNMAYMAKCFVISSCGTNSPEMIQDIAGTQEDRDFLCDTGKTGGSAIIAPTGDIIAGPMDGGQEGILYADVDLEATVRGRLVHDVGGHYNRADVFQLTVNRAPSRLLVSTGGAGDPAADERTGHRSASQPEPTTGSTSSP